MPEFSTKRRVPHAAGDMFELVADITKYPEFVPLCSALTVKSKTDHDDGKTVLVADMTVAYKIIRETFTSRVTLDRKDLKIDVEYLNGPFKRMHNRWSFRPAGERMCDVEFFIAYEFRSRTLAILMGTMFDTAFRRFAAAFEQRADLVYGK
ncbi:MAG TPA: type II toxin-antitoxin system RatA family toxin [Pseudolabrys sp.]|nr:type II toxin-antitoxin system RatA family toxin [Pseudolabrys sp.]